MLGSRMDIQSLLASCGPCHPYEVVYLVRNPIAVPLTILALSSTLWSEFLNPMVNHDREVGMTTVGCPKNPSLLSARTILLVPPWPHGTIWSPPWGGILRRGPHCCFTSLLFPLLVILYHFCHGWLYHLNKCIKNFTWWCVCVCLCVYS